MCDTLYSFEGANLSYTLVLGVKKRVVQGKQTKLIKLVEASSARKTNFGERSL
jgi:hypothetical protein